MYQAPQPQCLISVKKLYEGVIDDVIEGVREKFLNAGFGEAKVEELKIRWTTKMLSSKAIVHGGDSFIASGGPSTASGGTPVISEHREVVKIQISVPMNDDGGIQKYVTVNVAAALIRCNKLQEIITLPDFKAVLALPFEQIAEQLQALFDKVPKPEEPEQKYSIPGYVLIPKPKSVEQKRSEPQFVLSDAHKPILQTDGFGIDANAGINDQEEEEVVLDDMLGLSQAYSEDDDVEVDLLEDPLNSGDDGVEEEEDPEAIAKIEDVIFCRLSRVDRRRDNWKFYLKEGIMNLNGKDYVFHKAKGNAAW